MVPFQSRCSDSIFSEQRVCFFRFVFRPTSLKKFGFHYCFFFGRMLYLFSLLMLYIISRQNGIIAQLVRAPR